MSKFIFHADDIGLSKNITNTIIDSIDNGIITSTSIIVNGFDSINASKKLINRNITPCLHLNLSELKPISDNEIVSRYLCDIDGFLNTSFFKADYNWLISNKFIKKKIELAIKIEIQAQINKFKKLFPNIKTIKIDGHEHIHMSPIIFKKIIDISENFNLSEMRLSRENPKFFVFDFFRIGLNLNLLKLVLLSVLARIYRPILIKRNIRYEKFFFGIMYSGKMSEKIVLKIINKFKKKKTRVVVLLHPGYSDASEIKLWYNKKKWLYYNSDSRLEELAICKSDIIKKFI
jgi:predicted glycoside hydrolase/deacetylase ChbG (UPF0249 family)